MIERAEILICGWARPLWITTFGIVKKYHELKDKVGPNVFLGLYAWTDKEKILADLKRVRPRDVVFGAHSYGVHTGSEVCWKLLKELPDTPVSHFAASDGMWYAEGKGLRVRWQSLGKTPQIELPSNVRKVSSWLGSGLVIRGQSLKVQPGTELQTELVDAGHVALESHLPFLELIETLAMGN